MGRLKSVRENGHAAGNSGDKERDEALAALIKGVNMLIAQANGARLGTAVQILHGAKEELVHWAVNMNFHETARDRFIQQHLYDSGLFALGEFLAGVSALEDNEMKSRILCLLGKAMIAHPGAPPLEGNAAY